MLTFIHSVWDFMGTGKTELKSAKGVDHTACRVGINLVHRSSHDEKECYRGHVRTAGALLAFLGGRNRNGKNGYRTNPPATASFYSLATDSSPPPSLIHQLHTRKFVLPSSTSGSAINIMVRLITVITSQPAPHFQMQPPVIRIHCSV